MAYRDDAHSLRAYRDRVSAELEEARRAAREASERAQTVEKLEQGPRQRRGQARVVRPDRRRERRGSMPSLENVRVASPCNASWEGMTGDDRVRFCGKCEKSVYNLSAMPREEAEALLADRGGNLCVRFYKRADGTVLTEDCPVGVKQRQRVRLAMAAVGGGPGGCGDGASGVTPRALRHVRAGGSGRDDGRAAAASVDRRPDRPDIHQRRLGGGGNLSAPDAADALGGPAHAACVPGAPHGQALGSPSRRCAAETRSGSPPQHSRTPSRTSSQNCARNRGWFSKSRRMSGMP